VTSVPFDLPVRTGEAGALARILFEHGNRPLSDDLRNRLGVRAAALSLESIAPHFASLERDPIHPEAFYLAVDGINAQPLLMRFAPASTPSSGLFPKAILIGRLRVGPQETVINAVPFGPSDHERIRTFTRRVNPAFQPKVQGLKSTISVPVREGIFEHFRAIAKPLGLNVACLCGDLDAILWEAARSGWRDGYSAETAETSAIGYSRYRVAYGADLNSRLESISRARVSHKLGRVFDWELELEKGISVEEADRVLNECRSVGKPAQYVGFTGGKLPLNDANSDEWLALGRRQNFGFSFSGMDNDKVALRETARALNGRFNYRAAFNYWASADADLQELAAALFG
jgi:hypothetical protein